jgi:hypothetical protein
LAETKATSNSKHSMNTEEKETAKLTKPIYRSKSGIFSGLCLH